MSEAIYEKLKADHDRHRTMLDALDQAEKSDRASLLEKFRIEVTAHAAAEEESLYATMLANPELRHDAQHSVSEHKEIEDYFEELAELDPASQAWIECYGKLAHRYRHHIDEEEEDMFPAASEELSDATEKALADKFENRKPAELERAKYAESDERD